ncbi:MAG TPA: class I SAM-dependent methyltransferase [Ktedonobacterales bacterium]|nr:class I SAM-dependent methyltransferase [Ktedonobacterales bacterium]
MAAPKLYAELAEWWPLFSHPDEYAEEAAFFLETLSQPDITHRRALIEFGSGGGNNAFYLKAQFDLTLVDRSPQMLEVSRALNPECEHVLGDMRSVRLGRTFDAVFIHDAIDYMTTEADLRQACETAFVHCAPGGVALFVPDHVRETFAPNTEHGGWDGAGEAGGAERALRYLAWQFDPDPTDTTYEVHFAILLREGDTVRMEQDHHTCGLFARATWLQLLQEVGFAPQRLTDGYARDVFVGRKPL